MSEIKCDRTVSHWQIHNLTTRQEDIDKIYPDKNAVPAVFTATVEDDPTGKFQKGFHMRSSLIVEVDLTLGFIQTISKRYKIEGPEGDPHAATMASMLGITGGDLGDSVLSIFY